MEPWSLEEMITHVCPPPCPGTVATRDCCPETGAVSGIEGFLGVAKRSPARPR